MELWKLLTPFLHSTQAPRKSRTLPHTLTLFIPSKYIHVHALSCSTGRSEQSYMTVRTVRYTMKENQLSKFTTSPHAVNYRVCLWVIDHSLNVYLHFPSLPPPLPNGTLASAPLLRFLTQAFKGKTGIPNVSKCLVVEEKPLVGWRELLCSTSSHCPIFCFSSAVEAAHAAACPASPHSPIGKIDTTIPMTFLAKSQIALRLTTLQYQKALGIACITSHSSHSVNLGKKGRDQIAEVEYVMAVGWRGD